MRICQRLSWEQRPLCGEAALIPFRPRRWRSLRGKRACSLAKSLDSPRTALKSGKGSSRCPTIQGLAGEIDMGGKEGTVDVAIDGPYPACTLMDALAQELLCVGAAAVTILGESCPPRWKFDELSPAGLGLAAQHPDQHTRSATADALAPVVLPGFVAERLNLDGRAVGQDLVAQPPQGIFTPGRIAPPELGELGLGSPVAPGKAPLALLDTLPNRPVGLVMFGVHGTPPPILGALQPAYRGIVMAQPFRHLHFCAP